MVTEGKVLPTPSVRESLFIESGRLVEAVEGSEGLMWKAVLIEAGLSLNKRMYKPEVLQASIPLFEGAKVFIDHPTVRQEHERPERSLRDAAGWITDPVWDVSVGSTGAVVGMLHLLKSSPITPVVQETYERNKSDFAQLSIFGGGDQKFVGEGSESYWDVEVIKAIRSVDLVTFGAAGGRVVELMASLRREGEIAMLEELTLEEILEARPDLKALWDAKDVVVPDVDDTDDEVTNDEPVAAEPVVESIPTPVVVAPTVVVTEPVVTREPDKALVAMRDEIDSLKESVEIGKCTILAKDKIDATALPKVIKDRLVTRFSGRVFEATELDEMIVEEQTVYAAILDTMPKNPVRVVVDEKDKFSDVLTATVLDEEYEGQAPLGSIQRAYCMFNGFDPMATSRRALADGIIRESFGYDPGLSPLREAISWSTVLGATMNRILVKDYQLPVFNEWEQIVSSIRPLSDMKAQRTERIGYYGALPTVAAGGPYQFTTSPTEEEPQFTPSKRGMLDEWTWEDALNDNLGALRAIPKRLALAAKITLYQFVFDFIKDNSECTYDTTALFHANHSNTATTAFATDPLSVAKYTMRSQTALGSSITTMAVRPKFVLIPNELESEALRLRNSEYDDITDTRRANPHYQTFDVIIVDYWTDPTNWYVIADPSLVPTIELGFLGGKREPELFIEAPNTGSHFSADKVVMKIRFVFGGAIIDHRGMYGGIVAD